jgi:hypothetical protein
MPSDSSSLARIVYLYCLARPENIPSLQTVPGIEDELPFTFQLGALSAVVSLVEARTFCGPEAHTRLQDPAWIGPKAIGHERVVEHVMQGGPVLPVPLGTLFSSLPRLGHFLAANESRVLEFLDQGRNREEWAVKVFVQQALVKEHFVALKKEEHQEQLQDMSPGRRYVEEKKLSRGVEQEFSKNMNQIAHKIYEDLQDGQTPCRERSLLSAKATGQEHPMLLNTAFWVHLEHVSDFEQHLAEVQERYAPYGLYMDVSGPWPPYSFCPQLIQTQEMPAHGLHNI